MIQFPYKIRSICAEKDAAAISELVKKSFLPWLDEDNISYLNRMNKAGVSALAHPHWANITGFPYDLQGVVCEDGKGRILGVINSYLFRVNGLKCCLIANVCVDPEYRRQEIAAHMLEEVIRMQKAEHTYGIYLQARIEKPEIINFYRKYGFLTTDYRVNRILPLSKTDSAIPERGFSLKIVPGSDKNAFSRLFSVRYPASVLWNLDYRGDLFCLGISGELGNRLTSRVNRFRRVNGPDGHPVAWAALQRTNGFADVLWFIPNDGVSDREILNALLVIRKEWKFSRPVKTDIPLKSDSEVFAQAGFVLQHCLAWMWKKL